MSTISQPYAINGDTMELNFHKGQWAAWDSAARFVVVLAGTQGGKTAFGPHWLYREIQRRGPGDYLVVTPTYPLMKLKALPELERLFTTIYGLGEYKKADKVFVFDALGETRTWGAEQDTPTRIIFGHAQDPESLESATAKAAWLDEAGQNKFKLSSFEAIMRRLSLAQGRVLITTTPYNLGWLKQQLYDKQDGDSIEVIRFDSTQNPAFPAEEMERARRDLPRWKFDMFYRAMFTRPAGMIYDCFDDTVNKIAPFPIPAHWPRFAGVDFGGVNTAAVFVAQEGDFKKDERTKIERFVTTGRHYVYREYHEGGRTAEQHKTAMIEHVPYKLTAYGGASSEGQWRQEFGAAGLPIHKPLVQDVEVGIDRVYGAFVRGELVIFDTCTGLLDQIGSYARVLDDMGEPTEKIADKETYHLLDALRYVVPALNVPTSEIGKQPEKDNKWNVNGMTTSSGSRWRM